MVGVIEWLRMLGRISLEQIVPVFGRWDDPLKTGIVVEQQVTGAIARLVIVESASNRVPSVDQRFKPR